MNYLVLAKAYQELESTSKRLHKTKIVSNLLKKTDESIIDKVVLLLKGKVFPSSDTQDLGISNKLLLKAISLVTGFTTSKLEDEWRKTGDLGVVTQNLFKSKSQSTLFSETLTVDKVFDTLRKLSLTEGKGSTDQKIKLVSNLLSSASSIEAKYIVRTVLLDLRVGVATAALRDAIAWTYLVDPNYDDNTHSINPDREKYNEILEIVQSALDKTNDYALTAKLASKGINTLKEVKMKIGNPINVMLAKKTEINSVFKDVGSPCALEYKLDGFRMQIQKQNDKVIIFTRRLEDVTAQFPDVVKIINNNERRK